MKPRNYFGFALLLPYALWGICLLIVILLSTQETSEARDILLTPFAFYALGVILWFIPYTILAIGMWFWSKDRPTSALFKLALSAPLLFFAFMLISEPTAHPWRKKALKYRQKSLGKKCVKTARYGG